MNRIKVSTKKGFQQDQNLEILKKNLAALHEDMQNGFTQKSNESNKYRLAAAQLIKENTELKNTVNALTEKLSKVGLLYKELQKQSAIIQNNQKQKQQKQSQDEEVLQKQKAMIKELIQQQQQQEQTKKRRKAKNDDNDNSESTNTKRMKSNNTNAKLNDTFESFFDSV